MMTPTCGARACATPIREPIVNDSGSPELGGLVIWTGYRCDDLGQQGLVSLACQLQLFMWGTSV